jgi:type II secretion system protein G
MGDVGFDAKPNGMNMRRKKGFTLVELLIVVAIIGILAAIAIPNMVSAINRGRQKRSMADMHLIGTALEAYFVDYNYFPRVAMAGVTTTNWNIYLTATYIRRIPELDGWLRQYLAKTSTTGQSYTIWSKGRNGTGVEANGGPQTSFDAGIVFTNGQFVQWPEGLQTN